MISSVQKRHIWRRQAFKRHGVTRHGAGERTRRKRRRNRGRCAAYTQLYSIRYSAPAECELPHRRRGFMMAEHRRILCADSRPSHHSYSRYFRNSIMNPKPGASPRRQNGQNRAAYGQNKPCNFGRLRDAAHRFGSPESHGRGYAAMSRLTAAKYAPASRTQEALTPASSYDYPPKRGPCHMRASALRTGCGLCKICRCGGRGKNAADTGAMGAWDIFHGISTRCDSM